MLAKNQLVASQAGALSAMLPSIILSGMIFPVENMPRPLQLLASIVPAKYLVHGLRGVLLKGNGLGEIAPELWPIALFLAVVLTLGLKRYRRTLD